MKTSDSPSVVFKSKIKSTQTPFKAYDNIRSHSQFQLTSSNNV